jgi:hypothetical protein
VRDALATLPWVEKDSIGVDASSKMVTFGIKEKGKFDLEELTGKLSKKYQTGLKVEKAPE